MLAMVFDGTTKQCMSHEIISFCETTERYPTLLLNVFHLMPSPLTLQITFHITYNGLTN